jgi:hypothetical protein
LRQIKPCADACVFRARRHRHAQRARPHSRMRGARIPETRWRLTQHNPTLPSPR